MDFPTSPTVGTIIELLGVPTWRWNGNGWDRLSNAGVGDGNARLINNIYIFTSSEHETETILYV
jgi:hypothetical protein